MFYFLRLSSLLIFLLFFSACDTGLVDLVFYQKDRISLSERLEEFNPASTHWRLEKPVEIFWTEEAVPYIKALTDRDLFYATGLVQAHLRTSQLEMFRLLAQGRFAEAVGKRGLDMDLFLRTVDVGKRAPEIIQNWDKESLMAAQAFVEGLNDYHKAAKDLPLDLKLMGFAEIPPWTLKDLVSIHRLVSIDVNWRAWTKVMPSYRKKSEKQFKDFWKEWVLGSFLSKGDNKELTAFNNLDLLNFITEAGSNAFVVSGEQSKSGFPLVAGDPHLGYTMPNFWLLLGQESPSYKALGVVLPGFPIIAMGRTPHLAWTGTNMWTVSSYLYEIPESKKAELKKRKESFNVRFSASTPEIEVLESPRGPVISNTPFFKSNKMLALNWAGHRLSNELGALLKASKAKSIKEFREAFKTFSVVGINYVVADSGGATDKVFATHLPILKKPSKNFIQNYDNPVVGHKNILDLPHHPLKPVLASANEAEPKADPPLCWFCSTPDRSHRITKLLKKEKIGVAEAQKVQQDLFSQEAQELTKKILEEFAAARLELPDFLKVLEDWDFNYNVKALGPHSYETLLLKIAKTLCEEENLSKSEYRTLISHLSWKRKVLKKFQSYKAERKLKILKESLSQLKGKTVRAWGDLHKIHLSHPMARIPVLGEKFKYFYGGYPGAEDTVAKSSFEFGHKNYDTDFGANLRIIFDMQDLNENFYVLFGGQDGYLGSKNFGDQVKPWLKGEYKKLPFSQEKISSTLPYRVLLK